jgi:ADP-heptose:LPS heptosyltransferase
MWPRSGLKSSHCIVVLQLGHFGDMVLTLPLLEALKKHSPQALLRVVTTPAGAAVAGAFGAQDELLVPGSEVDCSCALDGADFIIHLRGGLRWVLRAFLSPRLGFVHGLPHSSLMRWAPLVLLGIPIRQTPEHQYETVARRLAGLGVSMLRHPVLEVEGRTVLDDWPPDAKYVVIHAGGNWKPRRWSEEGFYHVCADLWQKRGLCTVLIAAHETPGLSARLQSAGIPFHALDPMPRVRHLAGVLRGAALFVGNDSGPGHLAAALGVPCVVLYGPQDPRLFGILSDTSAIVKGATF